MVASANQLHVDITADCTSAVDAFEATKSAMRSLNGESATVSVGLRGAQDANNELAAVRQARMNAGGAVDVKFNSEGADEVGRQMAEHRRAAQGLSKDLEPLGRTRHEITVDSGSVRAASGDVDSFNQHVERGRVAVDGLAGALRGGADQHDAYGRSVREAEGNTRALISAHAEHSRSLASVGAGLDDAGSRVDSMGERFAANEAAVRSFGATGVHALGQMNAAAGELESSGSGVGAYTRQLQDMSSAARDARSASDDLARSTRGSSGSMQLASPTPSREMAMAGASGDAPDSGASREQPSSRASASSRAGESAPRPDREMAMAGGGGPSIKPPGPPGGGGGGGGLRPPGLGVPGTGHGPPLSPSGGGLRPAGLGVPGTADGPPLPPGGGGGGGGGGGHGPPLSPEGRGEGGGGFGGGLRKALQPSMQGLGGPAMVIGAAGVVGGAVTAGAGLESAKRVIKDSPPLTAAQTQAGWQFDNAVRAASQGAEKTGIPAFDQLGQKLQPLGSQVGQIGKEELPTVVGGVGDLATHGAAALDTLHPAIDPALKGGLSIAESLTDAVGTKQVAESTTRLGESAQDSNNMDALKGLTQDAISGGEDTLRVVGPALRFANSIADGKYNAATSGGTMVYNKDQDHGGPGATPGSGGGTSWNQESPVGRLMTAIGATTSFLGALAVAQTTALIPGVDAPGKVLGTQGKELGARWSNVFSPGSATPPSAAAGPSTSGLGMIDQVAHNYPAAPPPPKGSAGGGASGGAAAPPLPVPKVDQGFFAGEPGGAADLTKITPEGMVHGTRDEDGSIKFQNQFQDGGTSTYSYDAKQGLSSLTRHSPYAGGGTNESITQARDGARFAQSQDYSSVTGKQSPVQTSITPAPGAAAGPPPPPAPPKVTHHEGTSASGGYTNTTTTTDSSGGRHTQGYGISPKGVPRQIDSYSKTTKVPPPGQGGSGSPLLPGVPGPGQGAPGSMPSSIRGGLMDAGLGGQPPPGQPQPPPSDTGQPQSPLGSAFDSKAGMSPATPSQPVGPPLPEIPGSGAALKDWATASGGEPRSGPSPQPSAPQPPPGQGQQPAQQQSTGGDHGPPLQPGVQTPQPPGVGGGGDGGGSAGAPAMAAPPIPPVKTDPAVTGNAEGIFAAPIIGDLQGVPGQPGHYTGIVTNQFGTPPVNYDATTGKVTGQPGNPNQPDKAIEGQWSHETSLDNASISGRGPASAGHGQGLGRQISPAQAAGLSGRAAQPAAANMSGVPGMAGRQLAAQTATAAVTNAMAGKQVGPTAAAMNALTGYQGKATQTTAANQGLATSFNQATQASNATSHSQQGQTQAQQGLAQSSNAVAQGANQMSTSVSTANQSMTGAQQSAQGLAQGAQEMGGHVSDSIAGMTGGLGGLATAMGQTGAEAASALGGGLGKGAGDAASAGKDAGKDVGSAAADGGKDGMGAESPSKKFIQLGIWGGEGLAIGLRGSAPHAADAASGMAQSAIGAAISAVRDAQTTLNTTLAGGFGAGLIAASNGVTPIAQDFGLMLGYSWARNVVTGAQSVFEAAQFGALTVPKFDSKLAERNLGLLGMLPPAGSGAEYYQTTAGNAGMVQMTQTINPTINVSVDGTPLRVMTQQVVNDSFDEFARLVPQQR